MLSIPLYQPDLSGNERAYVLECLDTTWISSKGRFVSAFEQAFAEYLDAPQAISVCNGTVALHLALLALGIGPGDEVLVPTFTYVASVNAIRFVGATPVFVDSDPRTWQMDVGALRSRINARTRAVMAVHLYAGACDLPALRALCDEFDLRLVEDCAEAIGTRFAGRHVGNFGEVATFSFFGNKTLTTGEGGMVICRDPSLAENMRRLRGQGLVPGREYWHDRVGYNFRMTNLCAAIGLAQLERVEAILAEKRRVAARYATGFAGSGLVLQAHLDGVESGQWMVSVLAPDAGRCQSLRQALGAQGVETRPLFPPVHTMPMYGLAEHFPVAEDLAARGMNLPSWPGLSNQQIDTIVAMMRHHLDCCP